MKIIIKEVKVKFNKGGSQRMRFVKSQSVMRKSFTHITGIDQSNFTSYDELIMKLRKWLKGRPPHSEEVELVIRAACFIVAESITSRYEGGGVAETEDHEFYVVNIFSSNVLPVSKMVRASLMGFRGDIGAMIATSKMDFIYLTKAELRKILKAAVKAKMSDLVKIYSNLLDGTPTDESIIWNQPSPVPLEAYDTENESAGGIDK
ncbi:MAG: hypothetical protein IPP77_05990 [Bacteroidetes bacterium]|nr:hypothetical protein [Bacteroidota bacterium]